MDDDELLMISIEQQLTAITASCVAAANSAWVFDDDEPRHQAFVDRSNKGVRDQLAILQKSPSLFKVITNFTCDEFQELCELVCPLILGSIDSLYDGG